MQKARVGLSTSSIIEATTIIKLHFFVTNLVIIEAVSGIWRPYVKSHLFACEDNGS